MRKFAHNRSNFVTDSFSRCSIFTVYFFDPFLFSNVYDMACTRETDGSTSRNVVFTTDNKCIWLDRLDTMQSNWSHSLQPDTLHSYIEFYPPFARSNSYLRFLTPLHPFVPSLIPLISIRAMHLTLIPLLSASLACIWPTLVLFIPSSRSSSPFHFLSNSFPFNSLISSSAFFSICSPFFNLVTFILFLRFTSFQSDLLWWFQFECDPYPFVSLYDFDLLWINLCVEMKIQMFFCLFVFFWKWIT